MHLEGDEQAHLNRRGGAGPTDHQPFVINGKAFMVPVHTQSAWRSPLRLVDDGNHLKIRENDIDIINVSYVSPPQFYQMTTTDGIPFSKIATLHGSDVLATTVLQTCVRYQNPNKACKFCAIGQSLRSERTIKRKTPQQLAEVAKAAVELDLVKHMVMTTGTPPGGDRGARILCESVIAVKNATDLPIQVQCEPPDDFVWFNRLVKAGADSLGMHIELVNKHNRRKITPGKAQISTAYYLKAFAAAVSEFGRGQVSTYILAGLGDSVSEILAFCDDVIALGVYPFVVPFVPVSGSPLEDHPPPSVEFMQAILKPLAVKLNNGSLSAATIKAGCGRCNACSSLAAFENEI